MTRPVTYDQDLEYHATMFPNFMCDFSAEGIEQDEQSCLCHCIDDPRHEQQ
jgi:hypothetical protein